jgi:ElaB/YqjD/DUF883 family membrane-anchored ribosome-binding protein
MNIATPDLHSVAAPSAPDLAAASAAAEARELASREATRIDDMARDWWRRNAKTALDLAGTAKEEVAVAGDRTRRYVRDEPLRSVAIAAAAGAAIAALLMLFGRSRRH